MCPPPAVDRDPRTGVLSNDERDGRRSTPAPHLYGPRAAGRREEKIRRPSDLVEPGVYQVRKDPAVGPHEDLDTVGDL
ncbi:hypothetical protein [Actinacidiphila bryophytorum]|uniref:Uncharacterized protein n=1 Tax=Actinacidiphila bryophytorum TaxID=1436133 RepID=A0A9W4E710_9ACTN|nr:hypothetical protein [Actinacidiphila bryophytorum]MBM9435450.1 hypothetical protein [Actinacidiphila bryophytorum]MBN6546277.1 hypothetical protein [Actinacidiphila bryophytorum]CAG7608281.1 hypothetical protein SBRY_11126 [Actinacidiphila bryophytorum]